MQNISNPKLKGILNDIFKLKENNTNVKTEILAGFTIFTTMGYILFLIPKILSGAGMPVEQTLTALIIMVAITTIAMGVYTNRPFVLAPGLGSCGVFAVTLVQGEGISWEVAAGIVLISGICFLLVTVLGLRDLVVKVVPKSIKISISAAIGIKIALLGLRNSKIIVANASRNILEFGDLAQPKIALSVICLILLFIFAAKKYKGGVLLAVIIATIIGIPMGITRLPSSIFALPSGVGEIAFKLNPIAALNIKYLPFFFAFFISDFFSTFGTLLGVGARAGFLDEEGNLPGIQKCFMVDSIATIGGAMFGLPVMTTYLESAAGVESGGRTGLTSTTTAILFLSTLLITPLAISIPSAATAPVMIFLGLTMMVGIRGMQFEDNTEFLPALLCIIVTIFTYNIGNGIAASIISYVIMKVASNRHKELHPVIYFLALLLAYYFYVVVVK